MLCIYADENVDGKIIRGLERRQVDILTALEDGHNETADSIVLERAGQLGRLLFTQDTDFLGIVYRRLELDIPFIGVVYAHQEVPVRQCIEELELIAKYTNIEEYYCKLERIPLR